MTKDTICRYISYEAFEDMLKTNEMVYKSPLVWPDKYEGLIFRLLERSDVKERIAELASRYTNDPDEALNAISSFSIYMRCQCWTYNQDAVVMWNAYSYDKSAIMISTTKEEMKRLPVRLRNVEYVPNDVKIEDVLSNLMDNKGINITTVFCKKREAFKYENEVRYFLKSDTLRQGEIKEEMRVRVTDISEFIKKVLVHPEAESEYVNKVKELCKKYNIRFDGKSRLYDYENAFLKE